MDFLFASQDASTASLTWMIALMADHPDILQKVVFALTIVNLIHKNRWNPQGHANNILGGTGLSLSMTCCISK